MPRAARQTIKQAQLFVYVHKEEKEKKAKSTQQFVPEEW